MLIENLYQGRGIKPGTKPERVRQVMGVLAKKLIRELGTQYLWLAGCTVAVKAGNWGGVRREKRRLKLAELIRECANYLGEEDPIAKFPEGWERSNLFYGYQARRKYGKQNGLSHGETFALSIAIDASRREAKKPGKAPAN